MAQRPDDDGDAVVADDDEDDEGDDDINLVRFSRNSLENVVMMFENVRLTVSADRVDEMLRSV